jgi:alpha-methylacyl-CoA racemase
MPGPLNGLKIVELASIGPGPFCGMLLADLGADVIRVERLGTPYEACSVLTRGRRSIMVDLKLAAGAKLVLDLAARSDGFIEGFRPGVVERLGIGPHECLAVNSRLVYGRMTGWGQSGPLAHTAGHDIDYIAIAGALYGTGEPGRPPIPAWNLVGDYGGGAMFLAFGMVSAILHARQSGHGQVVDVAMTDGTALLTAMFHGRLAAGAWSADRGVNVLDGSAPFYGTYECADGQYIAFGAIEPQFTGELLTLLGLADDPQVRANWYLPTAWPELRTRVAEIIKTRTRSKWAEIFDGTDACAVPVLSLAEAVRHPHNVARETFAEINGVVQPGPAPRFSATPAAVRHGPPRPGEHTAEILRELGCSATEIEQLTEKGVVGG